MTNVIKFQNTELNILDRNGQKWLTASDISCALGYSQSDSVGRLYDRHKDEFSADMTATVNLTVVGTNLKAKRRIFNRRGAHLIAMFAKTDLAKEFRKWVLDVLDDHTQNQKRIARPQTAKNLMTLDDALSWSHMVGGIHTARTWANQLKILLNVPHNSTDPHHVMVNTALLHLDHTLFKALPPAEKDAANERAMRA